MAKSQIGQSLLLEEAVDDAGEALRIQAASNPSHMNAIVGVQVVPLKHGFLKTVELALHNPVRAKDPCYDATGRFQKQHTSAAASMSFLFEAITDEEAPSI